MSEVVIAAIIHCWRHERRLVAFEVREAEPHVRAHVFGGLARVSLSEGRRALLELATNGYTVRIVPDASDVSVFEILADSNPPPEDEE